MTFKLTISRRAHGDIDRNSDWWADHYSLSGAIKWSNTVYDQIEAIQEFPESHPLSAENDYFPIEIREKLVGLGSRRYRAIFTVKEGEVIVLTVRATEENQLQANEFDF